MSTGVFAFRMLVCQFRRELTFDDVFGFWERLWAAEQMAHYQLKVCLSGHTCDQFCPIHCQLRVCLSNSVTYFVPFIASSRSVCLRVLVTHLSRSFNATINPFVESFICTCLHTVIRFVLSFPFWINQFTACAYTHSFIPSFRHSCMRSLFSVWIPLICSFFPVFP